MSTRPETCLTCAAEVRWGSRDGAGPGLWLHREEADHPVKVAPPPRDWVLPKVSDAGGPIELGNDNPDEDELPVRTKSDGTVDGRIFVIPPVEIHKTPIEKGDPRLPKGARDNMTWAAKAGWEARATYSRASRVHASHGNLLGISDYVVVRFELDGTDLAAVASWEDGKFEFAYSYRLETKPTPVRLNSKALKLYYQQNGVTS